MAAKGLKFDNVYMVGMNEATMLGKDPTYDEIEESRRLNYVGMTRAKEAKMTFATNIFVFGQPVETKVSPFIEEIEERLGVKDTYLKEKRNIERKEILLQATHRFI